MNDETEQIVELAAEVAKEEVAGDVAAVAAEHASENAKEAAIEAREAGEAAKEAVQTDRAILDVLMMQGQAIGTISGQVETMGAQLGRLHDMVADLLTEAEEPEGEEKVEEKELPAEDKEGDKKPAPPIERKRRRWLE